jgi:hypothetical protein
MKFLSLVMTLFISTAVIADEALESNSFVEIGKKVESLNKKYGKENVLVVFDIDNTVLAMPQPFGSDQWFSWQYSCIGKKAKTPHCITSNMGELLDLQGRIFAVANMIPTETSTVSVIKKIQKSGQKTILLTSRGYQFRDSTERALKNVGLNFTDSAIGPKGGFPSSFIPYTMDTLAKVGLTKEEAKVAKLKKARKSSYQNGIMMNAGQHKGAMLKILLHKTGTKVKAIVFADDHLKHTVRMQAIFGKMNPIEVVTYRYGKIDAAVNAFKKAKKDSVHQAYLNFNNAMNKVFK